MWLDLKMPWVGQQCVILLLPDHTHLLFLLHAYNKANNGAKSVVIMSPDTDALCVHHFEVMGMKKLYFKLEEKGDTLILPDTFFYIQSISVDQTTIILQVYSIAGCDTCCAFYDTGKKNAFNVMMKNVKRFQSINTWW